jgi:aerobic carbon-monoxide dehydrogenase medium subunit
VLSPLQIHEPTSVVEASRLLAQYGEQAAVYAGGTELLVVMKERLVHYPHLINIKTIPGLVGITATDSSLTIGALATHREIERSPVVRERLPLLAELEANVANLRVRSTGTLGGNLCFAEPHSDPATLLIALDADALLVSATGERRVSLADFFTGLLETVRRPDEVLTEVRIPLPAARAMAYERFKTHERPTATVAVTMTLDGGRATSARIVTGSVGARPVRMAEAESALVGQIPNEVADVVAALAHDEVDPTVDGFESGDYKRHLVRVLTTRAILAASARGD